MATMTEKETIRTLTTHYIEGAFVESHGREVMDIINPTNGQVIARVRLADEEDARRAIAAARRAFASFGRTTKEERAERELVFPFRQACLGSRCRLYRSHQAQ